MFGKTHAFSGMSVNDLDAAEKFYGKTLGLKVERDDMGLNIHLADGLPLFIYEKENHQPATYTALNFVVDDVDKAAADLKAKGIELEHYKGMTGDDGVARGLAAHQGPDIAWFKDPAGNILSILQEK